MFFKKHIVHSQKLVKDVLNTRKKTRDFRIERAS
jgi:hypothetical protein